MNSDLHVAVSTDDAYTIYTGIMLYSLFENNKNFKTITVHVLDNGMTEDGKDKFNDIAKHFQRTIVYYDCTDPCIWAGSDIVKLLRNSESTLPVVSYSRLFLTDMIDSNINKIIYLDSDAIVLRSYEELWNLDTNGFSMMGVLDCVGSNAKKAIGLEKESKYINAGVLLMNLKKLREIHFTDKVKDFIKKFDGNVFHSDQGVVNGVLHNTIGYLSPQYNMMTFVYEYKNASDVQRRYSIYDYYSNEQMAYAKSAPVFIHFTEGNMLRPWVKGCNHPLRSVWEEYRNKTVWKNTPLEKNNKSLKFKILVTANRVLPIGLLKLIFNR